MQNNDPQTTTQKPSTGFDYMEDGSVIEWGRVDGKKEPRKVKPMKIEAWRDVATDEIRITIVVPPDYIWSAKLASPNLSHLIDMPQFFGMLEDAVCMKLGIEPPKTDRNGHNVAA